MANFPDTMPVLPQRRPAMPLIGSLDEPAPPAQLITQGTSSPTATLAALMARQKAAAARQAGVMQQGAANIPQGLGQLAWTFVNAMQERRAAEEEAQGRQQLAALMGQIDPVAGPTGEQLGQIGGYDPDLAVELYKTRAAQQAAQAKQENWEPIPTPEGETGQWYRDTVTGKTQKVGGGSEGGGPKLSDLSTFRSQITSLPSYQNMANAEPMWASMQDAVKRDTAQADLNLVIAMAKLFDPTSVVRTEEGEMVRQTGGLPSQLYGYFKMLTGEPGARLGPEVRAGMLQEAASRMQGYNQAWLRDRERYAQIAAQSGIDPINIPSFAEVAPPEGTEPPAAGGTTAPAGDAAATPPAGAGAGDAAAANSTVYEVGKVYEFEDGKGGKIRVKYKGGDSSDQKNWEPQ